MEIRGRTFLVTGAGSGLGAATANVLANEGTYVVVADLKGEAAGDNVRFVQTDVTDEEGVKDAIDAALQGFGGLHGAINCAGIGSAEKDRTPWRPSRGSSRSTWWEPSTPSVWRRR